MEVTEAEIHAYAVISGDDNPIHVDKGAAMAAGLSTTCAHGMLVTGKLFALLQNERLLSTIPRRTKFNYVNPISANEHLEIQVWPDDAGLKVKISNEVGLAIKGTIEF